METLAATVAREAVAKIFESVETRAGFHLLLCELSDEIQGAIVELEKEMERDNDRSTTDSQSRR